MRFYYIKGKPEVIYDAFWEEADELPKDKNFNEIKNLDGVQELIDHCNAFNLDPEDFYDDLDTYYKDQAISVQADNMIDLERGK